MRYPDNRSDVLEGLMVALAQFGLDADARLNWLVGFVDRDLKDREAAEAATHEAMLFVFSARMAKVGPRAPARIGGLDDDVRDPRQVREAVASVERAQREVRQALKAFAVDGRCTLPFKVVGWERVPDGRVLPLVGGDWWSRFYGAIFALVSELGRTLGVCANAKCQRLFARSKRQAYCGPRCSQRERTLRFREMHPDRVSDQRHATYVRAQRKRLGEKVSVGRARRAKTQDRER